MCVDCRQFLSMMRALLHLAEQMHYSEVMALLATPLKHCPEVLFLNLIECMVSKNSNQLCGCFLAFTKYSVIHLDMYIKPRNVSLCVFSA